MYKVSILALPGAFPSTIFGPMEIFRWAGIAWNRLVGEPEKQRFDVRVVSFDGKPVSCYGGIKITPEGTIHMAQNSNVVIIPSAGLTAEEVLSNSEHAIFFG